jgi:sugar lactone lactonase YvrE
MRPTNTFIILASLATALLAGCSQSGSAGTPLAVPPGAPPAARSSAGKATNLIYSSSYGGNSVTYYLKGTGPNNPVAGTLSGSYYANPLGMGVDRAGDLYISNANDRNVLVYAAGSTKPTNTLDDPDKFPTDVAVAADGNVYVANSSGPIGASGNVVVYAPGATSPTRTLSDPGFYRVMGVALDKSGNVWVSYNFAQGIGSGTVAEFKAGSSTPKETHVKIGSCGGIAIDKAGHFLVVDEEVPSVNVYRPGQRKPLAKLPLPGTAAYLVFNKMSDVLYVADYGLGEIDVFDYTPSKLTQTNTITNGITPSNDNLGVAVTPVQRL